MTKEEIVKYITSSPENTNPNVLEGMLDELVNNNSGGSMFIVDWESEGLNKTWNEINTAMEAGQLAIIRENSRSGTSFYYITGVLHDVVSNVYTIIAITGFILSGIEFGGYKFTSLTADGKLNIDYSES